MCTVGGAYPSLAVCVCSVGVYVLCVCAIRVCVSVCVLEVCVCVRECCRPLYLSLGVMSGCVYLI